MSRVRFRQTLDFSSLEDIRRRREESQRRKATDNGEIRQEETITDWANYPSVSKLFDWLIFNYFIQLFVFFYLIFFEFLSLLRLHFCAFTYLNLKMFKSTNIDRMER